MRLLAIDPGPTESAWVLYDTINGLPVRWGKCANTDMRQIVRGRVAADHLAIEMIASYGMAVGVEVFETCVWIGRLDAIWCMSSARSVTPPAFVYRRDVKLHLCGNNRAKDANVRQALIDRYGPGKEKAVGRKASPGPLYGLTGDCWAALGVAVTVADTMLDDSEKAA